MTKRARRSRPEIGPLVGDLSSFSGSLALVITFGEFLGHLAVERRNVVRLTARHEAHVGDDFSVDPVAAGVANVGLQRGPRGEGVIAHDVRLDEEPRTVAYRGDRLAGVEHRRTNRTERSSCRS